MRSEGATFIINHHLKKKSLKHTFNYMNKTLGVFSARGFKPGDTKHNVGNTHIQTSQKSRI